MADKTKTSLFRYLMTATDAAKKNLKADHQARLIRRELEGKIDSLELKALSLEADLETARQDLAVASSDNVKSKLQKILDIKLDIEASTKAHDLLTEELSTLFDEDFVPPVEPKA